MFALSVQKWVKLLRIQHCKDIVKESKKDKNFLYNIVTGDETWCFQYDPETKRQSAEWRPKNEPATKKSRFEKSKVKTMLICRVLFIMSSFNRAKQLLRHIILVSWSGCCIVFVAFGQNIVRKGVGVCCTIMRRLIDRRSSPIFWPKIAFYWLIIPRIRLIWHPVTFIYSENFICRLKACAMPTFRPFKRRVPTSSEPCRPTT